jgi:hypothetical protein
MFDQINAFNPRRGKIQFYVGSLATNAGGWLTWVIPRNASWVYMLCVGGGSGGGGGQNQSGGIAGGGGGGGGSGALAKLLIPASFLPKTLYLSPGIGGAQVGAGATGSAGVRSFIADKPFASATTTQDLVLVSGAAAATGGQAGALTGSGGNGETIATTALQPYASLGLWTAIAGQAGGTSGSSGAAGTAVVWGGAGIPFSGGGGGGSTNTTTGTFAGGGITGAGLVPTLAGGVAGGATPGNPGLNLTLPTGSIAAGALLVGQVFATTGGSGAGSNATGGTIAAGGKGGIGSGGGGGGGAGGTTGGTGGPGGAGGPGLIVIAWW